MHQADFSNSILSAVIFTGSDLKGAIFDGSNLEKADFSQASNYTIDPTQNRMKGARFATNGLSGLLTTHGIIIT